MPDSPEHKEIAVASVEAIRKALLDKKVSEDDPAFLVLTACEMSLRALEEIPRAINKATEDKLLVLDGQTRASAAKIYEADLSKLDELYGKIELAATEATDTLTKDSFEAAQKQLKNYVDNRYLLGFSAGTAVVLISSALSYHLGEFAAGGGFALLPAWLVRPSKFLRLRLELQSCPRSSRAFSRRSHPRKENNFFCHVWEHSMNIDAKITLEESPIFRRMRKS